MKLSFFIRSFFILFVVLFVSKSWALYENKEGYPYTTDHFGVYISSGIAASGSNTFDLLKDENYEGIYIPTRTLSSGVFKLAFGARLSDFRLELEYGAFYQWYAVFNNKDYHTDAISPTSLPKKGTENLRGVSLNAYYDARFISDILYPYLGVGAGYARATYHAVDTVLQPNGLGEAFYGKNEILYAQFMLGLQYDLKLIRSSVSIEYRYARGQDLTVKPDNDGLNEIASDDLLPGNPDSLYPDAEDWIEPAPTKVTPEFHTIMLSIKYYLQ